MDAFFCIVLSYLVLRYCWRSDTFGVRGRRKLNKVEPVVDEKPAPISLEELAKADKIERAQKEAQRQKDKNIEELRKQGYTDELIAVILPQINNQ